MQLEFLDAPNPSSGLSFHYIITVIPTLSLIIYYAEWASGSCRLGKANLKEKCVFVLKMYVSNLESHCSLIEQLESYWAL